MTEKFVNRHIGPSSKDIDYMLGIIGVNNIDQLIDETIPKGIRSEKSLDLPLAQTEAEFIKKFKGLAQKNKVFRSYIGMGYYESITPPVIQRNILENPGWYTAYTPYQAEIAQGRLEAIINYQTMISDLAGMQIANASLLDEGTAAAEAMSMLHRVKAKSKKTAYKFFIEKNVFPQTLDVMIGRAEPMGIEVIIGERSELDISDPDLFGICLQYPDSNGAIHDPSHIIAAAQESDVKTVIISDLMALVMLKSPGEMGADVVVGTSQRFGIPLGYGGPHAAFFATKEDYKRQVAGRIIGVTQDSQGNVAYRMALQTREQHIRREKATSNICTAQVLLAVMAGMYAVYHGKEGLQQIANRIHSFTASLNANLEALGYNQENECFFDTLKIKSSITDEIRRAALSKGINFRYFENGDIGISLNETVIQEDIDDILEIFRSSKENHSNEKDIEYSPIIKESLERTSDFLSHPVFSKYHSEHEMLRYMKRLENKDLSLVHSMISLGSCTMKLNATSEMIPLSWPEFGNIHPFVPFDQALGYHEMFDDLSTWLSEITGFYSTSLQPNSGAQGELAGLMVIRAMFESKNEGHRNITLIPTSAHGTNPASAIMAGQKVVLVKCEDNGDINLEDLKEKAELHKDNLMALMVTYPSTHGVFEEGIVEACQIIHDNGGRVYMDGANLNAQLGLTSPGKIGADVCHLNLHKTFCIPHGGGGPGMGPIAVTEELTPFLPANAVVEMKDSKNGIHGISAAPWGSASILTISYAYIAMMGGDGLKRATEIAILNANYIKERLKDHYDVLYTGKHGHNAHELIIDLRHFKEEKIGAIDLAKRLMDYGFHAPTVSFPVGNTMMIEPTESETLEELDRFCDAMISIRNEITEISRGNAEVGNNLLSNAPHTMYILTADNWEYPYARTDAAFPLPYVQGNKFWPSVGRVDDAYGDRNLMCSCPPLTDYENDELQSAEEVLN
jgi:glycine dehydrogenase